MDRDTLRFIDRIYKDLYKSPEVLKHSSGNETEKFKNLEEYLNTLESVHERAAQSDERIKTIKRMYYNKYVIKKENIPDSYYENQKRIALERGFGHIEIDEWQRDELQKEVIENQKASLDTWLDYLMSEDAKFYPFWAKYWAFQGMLKMGIYDKDKGSFSKRTNETAAPFVDLNREALAKSIDLVIKMVGKEKIDDRDLEIIVHSGSFPKIYQHVLTKILNNNENVVKRNQGIWVKYERGSDHMPLVNSLQGYNTGWCTAGENTAKSQLAHGDFYVYYTLDEKDEYKVPRIAIRMENYRIAEIRGIAGHQNIEPEMEKVVEEKIQDFPDKEEYFKKVEDMKKLTVIYNKYWKTKRLTKSDLRFLYEIDGKIHGFGYEEDPRILEILVKRDVKKDLARVFDCDPSQIAIFQNEIRSDTVCYDGSLNYKNLEFKSETSIRDFPFRTSDTELHFPKYVIGNLNLYHLDSLEGVELPEVVIGDVVLSSLTEEKIIKLPRIVEGTVDLRSLATVDEIIFPETLAHKVFLNVLKSHKEKLVFPRSLGAIKLGLSSLENVVFPEYLKGDLVLPEICELHDVEFPKSIGGSLTILWVENITNVTFPRYVGRDFAATRIKKVKNVTFPEIVGGKFELGRITNVDNIKLPIKIGGSLRAGYVKSINGAKLPEYVGETMYFHALESAENTKFPKHVGFDARLDNLKRAINVEFPEEAGTFYAHDLTYIENTKFPRRIKHDCHLEHLESDEVFTIPEFIGGYLITTKYEKSVLLKQIKNSKLPISYRNSNLGKLDVPNKKIK